MARQRPTRIPTPHIDRIVIRKVQYQLEVNRCRNEEIIVKDNFGWVWPIMGGAPQVEIDRIVIRDVQYQFEVNRYRNEEIIVKGNCGWAWPMWAGRPRIDCIVIKEVQYQIEVNRCRNEEIIVKGNFEWALPMWAGPIWAGRPRIDRIVIREVQYQFEVNRCRNEEIIVNGNFGWAWPMWAGCPRIDRIVIREVQYKFEVNRCRNEEIILKKAILGGRGICGRGAPGLVMGPCIVEIDLIVIREAQFQFEVNRYRNEEVNFQGSSANSVGGAGGQDGRTDAHQYNIPTFSPKNFAIIDKNTKPIYMYPQHVSAN
ncbi:hypothetical protein DPMN_176770 [Dreissena polymorpha]|uniref:Uncharacterized protein n=1 Tax=Dreissena polymorpha TaxID=45954 RepID=A0A9D4IJJ4_DREPO|nr:hypothetical protein DPMN_176770 [Dreissena polymorpha]